MQGFCPVFSELQRKSLFYTISEDKTFQIPFPARISFQENYWLQNTKFSFRENTAHIRKQQKIDKLYTFSYSYSFETIVYCWLLFILGFSLSHWSSIQNAE